MTYHSVMKLNVFYLSMIGFNMLYLNLLQECKHLIAESEKLGYIEALLNIGGGR